MDNPRSRPKNLRAEWDEQDKRDREHRWKMNRLHKAAVKEGFSTNGTRIKFTEDYSHYL